MCLGVIALVALSQSTDRQVFDLKSSVGWEFTGSWSLPAPASKVEKFRLFKDRNILVSLVSKNSDTGVARSPEFIVDRTYLNFRVAGGQDGKDLTVCLVIDDEVVEKATGNDSLTFTSVSWNLAKFKGKHARLVLTDHSSSSPYGFIALNDIVLSESPTNTGALPQFGLPDGAFQKRLNSAQTVHRRYLVVPVLFDDTVNVPIGSDTIEDLFSNRYPGLSHFMRNVSYGAVDLEGTKVMPWTALPGTAGAYMKSSNWSAKRLLSAIVKKFRLNRLTDNYDGVVIIPPAGARGADWNIEAEEFESSSGLETTQVLVINPNQPHLIWADTLVYAEVLRLGRFNKFPLSWRYDQDLPGNGSLRIAQEPTVLKKYFAGWIDGDVKVIKAGENYSGLIVRNGAPEASGAPCGIFMQRPGSKFEGWYVEFRDGFGYDAPAENAQPRVAITRVWFDTNERSPTFHEFVWTRTSLLAGSSFSDPTLGFSITVKSIEPLGALVSCASTGS